jgi:hypothetical protein
MADKILRKIVLVDSCVGWYFDPIIIKLAA